MRPPCGPVEDTLRKLVHDASSGPPAAAAVANAALSSVRPLSKTWWHGGDIEQAIVSMSAELADHGLEAATSALRVAFEAHEWADEDDEDIRRHQLGTAAVLANEALEAAGSTHRFRCFSRKLEWETDEPFWILVDAEEHETLIRLFGGPPAGGLEAAYDAAKTLSDVPVGQAADRPPLRPHEAGRLAQAAAREARWGDALSAAEIAVEGPDIVSELIRIEALLRLGRRDEAGVAWRRTAGEWLSGVRKVYRGWPQWARLEALGKELEVDAQLLERVAAQR